MVETNPTEVSRERQENALDIAWTKYNEEALKVMRVVKNPPPQSKN